MKCRLPFPEPMRLEDQRVRMGRVSMKAWLFGIEKLTCIKIVECCQAKVDEINDSANYSPSKGGSQRRESVLIDDLLNLRWGRVLHALPVPASTTYIDLH